MANIAYLEVPADNVRLAEKFYLTLRRIEPTRIPGAVMKNNGVTGYHNG